MKKVRGRAMTTAMIPVRPGVTPTNMPQTTPPKHDAMTSQRKIRPRL
jgi:hypothetical protein